MIPTGHRKVAFAFAILSSLPCLTSSCAEQIDLLTNGGFEKGTSTGLPESWTLNGVGSAETITDAHGGKRALRIIFGKESTGCYAPKIEVRSGVEYHAGFWARGTGALQLIVYQYSESGHFMGSKFFDARVATQDWKRFDEIYKTPDAFVSLVAFALHVVGDGSAAAFDDASFSYDATKYPPPEVETPETALSLTVETRDAEATVFIDGTETAPGTAGTSIKLIEGAHVLSLTATATGDRPAVRILCPEHPYLQSAFRGTTTPADGWMKAGCDDSTWVRAEVAEDGWMWLGNSPGRVCFRQVIGYTHSFHGPQRCIAPRVKQWEWPQHSMQVVNLWLRPLDDKAKVNDFHFILDVPQPFRMLATETRCVNWFSIITPKKVIATPITRSGLPYTRYDIAYPSNFHTERPTGCFSAVCLKPDAYVRLKEVTFYYRRQPSVNQTELEVAMPVRMLPPVNGKMPKQILQWSPLPPVEDSSGISSKEEALESARLHAAMGINTWSARPDPFARSQERKDRWDEALREFQRLGGRYGIWLNNSLGLNYGFAEYFAPGPARYLKEHPECRARWYRGVNPKTYGENHFNYCNEWAGSDDSAPFWDEIQKTYAMSLVNWPHPAFLFFDWEHARIDRQGNGNHCFCDRCKKAFCEFANLPAGAVFDDETIVKKYAAPWTQFRCFQDARIYARIKKRCNALGQKMMLYVAGGDIDPVRYAKGCLDIFHEGTPGNGYAYSSQLNFLTAHFDEMRKTIGNIPMLPQMLPSFPNNGFNTEPSLDGYYHPRLLAVTNLVGVLATRGGGMEHWLIPSAYSAGAPFYVGESNRLMASFEEFFTQGERHDELVTTNNPCGKVVVLTHGKERLILAFNDKPTSQRVTLTQKGLPGKTKAVLCFDGKPLPNAGKMEVAIPGEYLAAIHVKAAALR